MILYLKKEERKELDRHLLNENYVTWSSCGYVIALMQLIMLVTNLISGVMTERTFYYRWLYIALIAVTVLAEVLLYVLKKNERTLSYFYDVGWGYMLAINLWSIGITYISFMVKQDLSSFAYTAIGCCAIILMDPLKVILNLSFNTGLLIALLFSRPSFHASVGTLIQILSIYAIAVIVSVVGFNRRLTRVRLEYEQASHLREIRELNDQLKRDAQMDVLTGVCNRRFLTEHINDTLKTGSTAAGILMIDIDHFKRINDTYGHQVGDECLIVLGGLIRGLVNDRADYAVRYGGEEFLVYYERISDYDLHLQAELLREQLKRTPLKEDGKEIFMTVSIGCALASEGVTYSALISTADGYLYEAKKNGRDRVCPAL